MACGISVLVGPPVDHLLSPYKGRNIPANKLSAFPALLASWMVQQNPDICGRIFGCNIPISAGPAARPIDGLARLSRACVESDSAEPSVEYCRALNQIDWNSEHRTPR